MKKNIFLISAAVLCSVCLIVTLVVYCRVDVTEARYASVVSSSITLNVNIVTDNTGNKQLTLNYNITGETSSSSVTVYSNSPFPPVTVPEWEDHLFLGFYTAASGGDQWYDSQGVATENASYNGLSGLTTADTLYAHWSEIQN